MTTSILSTDGKALITTKEVVEDIAALENKKTFLTALITRYTAELVVIDAKIAAAVSLGYTEV